MEYAGDSFCQEKDPLLRLLAAGKRRNRFRGLLSPARGKTGDLENYRLGGGSVFFSGLVFRNVASRTSASAGSSRYCEKSR